MHKFAGYNPGQAFTCGLLQLPKARCGAELNLLQRAGSCIVTLCVWETTRLVSAGLLVVLIEVLALFLSVCR